MIQKLQTELKKKWVDAIPVRMKVCMISAPVVNPEVNNMHKGYELLTDHKCGITDDGVRYCTSNTHFGFYVTKCYL